MSNYKLSGAKVALIMKVYSWETTGGNFGDDLNAWLWPELLPGEWPGGDDVVLCGVGTILTDELSDAGRLLIFGSGAGYGTLPPHLYAPSVICYGVRGPLTAKLCGFGEDKVLADPAILIPDVLSKDPEVQSDVVFVPHVHSALRADWGEICHRAGVELVDPRGESKTVIRKLASANLVLAESMHAAIIADAYRVPWIPVWSSREISYFKWLDWSLSVGAMVKPRIISPPSRLAWLDNLFATVAVNNNARCAGVTDDGRVVDQATVISQMQELIAWRGSSLAKFSRTNYLRVRQRVFKPVLKLFPESERQTRRATESLKRLADQTGSLSSVEQFDIARDRLYAALTKLKTDIANNFENLN